LKQQIYFKIPEPVVALINNYFDRCFEANTKIKFRGPLKNEDAILLFLNLFVTYLSARDYVFVLEHHHKHPHSNFHDLISKFIPLLDPFSKHFITWETQQERQQAAQ
jgi:hypothetical protein